MADFPESHRYLLDAQEMLEMGVARVYTPKDFDLNRIMGEIAELIERNDGAAAPAEEGRTAEAGSAA